MDFLVQFHKHFKTNPKPISNSTRNYSKMTKYIYPASFGVTDDANEDTNDCALRAYCNVTGVSFKDAQIRFAKQGRKYKRGTHYKVFHAIYTNAGMSTTLMGSTRLADYVKYVSGIESVGNARTLKSLLEDRKYSKGKHVFISRVHAMAVIDGKIVDTHCNKQSARVYLVYTMPEVSIQ